MRLPILHGRQSSAGSIGSPASMSAHRRSTAASRLSPAHRAGEPPRVVPHSISSDSPSPSGQSCGNARDFVRSPLGAPHARTSANTLTRNSARADRLPVRRCRHCRSIRYRRQRALALDRCTVLCRRLLQAISLHHISAPTPLPQMVKKMEVTEQGIKFNKKSTLPYEPFVGTLGVSRRSKRCHRA
jgi:hypothetical protein